MNYMLWILVRQQIKFLARLIGIHLWLESLYGRVGIILGSLPLTTLPAVHTMVLLIWQVFQRIASSSINHIGDLIIPWSISCLIGIGLSVSEKLRQCMCLHLAMR